jgi:hypothetical protein
MAPMLWEELELEPETSPRRLATILKLRNGITPHIRRIFVLYSYVGMGSQCPPAFETVIQLLIGALPGNHLRTFVSQVVTSTPLLLHLFQRQSILDEFDIRTIDFTNAGAIDFRKPTHTSWVLPSLTSIKTLAMSLNRDDVESYRTSGFFIRNASKLKELHLRGMGSGRTIAPLVHPSGLNVFDRLGANDGHPQLNISRLTLETMGLGPPGLTEYIDCGQLTSLQVIRCSNSMQLMMALAPEFKRACTLSELRITVPRHHGPPEETTQAVETLLQSFSGLEKLWLDLAGGRMVNVACIAGHGSSLKLIGLGASPRAPVNYLSAADLATVLQSAPRLESLAINLCPVSLGNTKAVGAGFKLRAASEDPYAAIELETYLVSIILCVLGETLTNILTRTLSPNILPFNICGCSKFSRSNIPTIESPRAMKTAKVSSPTTTT